MSKSAVTVRAVVAVLLGAGGAGVAAVGRSWCPGSCTLFFGVAQVAFKSNRTVVL